MSIALFEKEIKLGERLEKVIRYAKPLDFGPATFFGMKVNVINLSDRYVWFTVGDKELRAFRHWIYGNARQGGHYAI